MIAWWAAAWAAPDLDRLAEALAAAEQAGVLYGEVRVVDGDELVFAQRYGGAPEGGRYRVGSVTKSMTAALVLAAAERGALGLDDPVVSHLPELHELGGDDPITVRHLLHHTSGLGGMQLGPFSVEPRFEQWVTGMRDTGQLAREAPPGTQHRYSNGGYVLLTEILRRIEGRSYEATLRARLFDPLGMPSAGIAPTHHDVRGALVTPLGRVDAQRALPGWIVHDVRWDLGGDGAVSATAEELVAYASGLRAGRVLGPASLDALTTPALNDYAMGWAVQGDHVWHNGALSPVGAYAYLRWSRTDDRVVVLLNAVDVGSVTPELRLVVEGALAGEPVVAAPVVSVPAWVATLSVLYTPWWLGLGPIAGLAWWARRPGRTRVAVWLGGLAALGWSVGVMSVSGALGPLVACAALAAAVAPAARRAAAGRPARWWLWALAASVVLVGGLAAAGLVLFLRALMADPWTLMT